MALFFFPFTLSACRLVFLLLFGLGAWLSRDQQTGEIYELYLRPEYQGIGLGYQHIAIGQHQ